LFSSLRPPPIGNAAKEEKHVDIVPYMGGRPLVSSLSHRGKAASSSNSFMRQHQNPPSAGRLLQRFDVLDEGALRHMLQVVWSEVLDALHRPVRTIHGKRHRSVTFMGVMRFRVNMDTGVVFGEERVWLNGRRQFRKSGGMALDHPGMRSGNWMDLILQPWLQHIRRNLLDDMIHFDDFHAALVDEIKRATMRSCRWKQVCHAFRNALNLDRDVLRWCRKGSHRIAQAAVTLERYNRTLLQRGIYEQLERENPNLIWVYNLALDDKVWLEPGDAAAALKQAVLRKPDMTPACWRLLCRSKEQDFRNILDWYDPDGSPRQRWWELAPWLRLLVMLRCRTPLPRNVVQSLFMHDSTESNRVERSANVRNTWMPVQVVRILVQEAERQHASGRLRAFVDSGLTDVVTWYEATRPNLDKNQIGQGFPYLERRAAEWKLELAAKAELGPNRWTTLSDARVGPWTIVHLADAFMLRQEALRMRHCADRYAEDCKRCAKSIFSVRNSNGKSVATIGLEHLRGMWHVFSFRGFANQPVPAGMRGLEETVCHLFRKHCEKLHRELEHPQVAAKGIGEEVMASREAA